MTDRPATNGRPRVTLGLPVHNGENFLAEALESLLAQTYRDFEVVIADNASDDGTEEICRSFADRDARIRYFRNLENVGAARNYNLVVDRARGEYFKWAAHDDLLEPTFVERCVGILDREDDVVACYPRTRYVDEGGHEQRVSRGDLSLPAPDPAARVRELVTHEIASDDVLMSVFGMFRTESLRKTSLIGGYPASDQVLVLELALLGRFREIPEPLFNRRMHALTSMTKNRTPHDQARWFDPTKQRRIILPVWSLWRAHNSVIGKSGLSFGARLGCYYHLARRFLRMPGALAGEMKKAVFQLFGAR